MELKDINIKESFKKHFEAITDYDLFIDYSTRYLRRAIRVNTLKISVEDLKERMKAWNLEQVPWCPEGFWVKHDTGRRDIGNTPEHQLGYYYVQEPASMIPPLVLDPKPDDLILDMCASPGSKTTQIAQYMQNEGLLIANDYKSLRMRPLGINIQRMGISNTALTIMSGRRFEKIDLMFDKILVDAPCSGTGTIRKSLKTLEIWNENMTAKLAKEQYNLLKAAYSRLKPGGVLVYSTCSVEPEENEGVISKLLNETNAEILDIDLSITRSPVVSTYVKEFNPRVSKALRIWPQDNDTEGFFVAKLKKI